MKADPAKPCDARHGNERCTKALGHVDDDPWHESLRYLWRLKPAEPPASFGPPQVSEPGGALDGGGQGVTG